MSNIIKISAGFITMFIFLQSASAQGTGKGSEIDTYTQVMLFVVLLLVTSVFYVLIFLGDMEDKVIEIKAVKLQTLNIVSTGIYSAAGNKISFLFRTALIAVIAAALLYLIMIIIFLKNV
ncbi:MAG: hypothetical protein ABI792_04265 [bacterium]